MTTGAPPALPVETVIVYELATTDPWTNLAAEEWIFASTDWRKTRALLLYRNEPAVVIGRHQNPWLEVNIRRATADSVPILRRRSGGGTVYHDLGNINFSFLSERAAFSKTANAQLVVRALEGLGVAATVGPRNDLLVDGLKVSGAAYRITAHGAYHHGTLLINADLPRLRQYLAAPAKDVQTNSVASVRSPVANLSELQPGLTDDDVVEALVAAFYAAHPNALQRRFTIADHMLMAQPAVERIVNELQAPAWIWDETPEFVHTLEGQLSWGALKLRLHVVAGRIGDAAEAVVPTVTPAEAIDVPHELVNSLAIELRGAPYGADNVQTALRRAAVAIGLDAEADPRVRELREWLLEHV